MKERNIRLVYWLPALAISTIGVLLWVGAIEHGQTSALSYLRSFESYGVETPEEVNPPNESGAKSSTLQSANWSPSDDNTSSYGDMARMPTGTFIMGLTDEDVYDRENAGRVVLAMTSYYIDRFEVTNREYLEFIREENDRSLLPDAEAWGGDEDAMVSYLTQPQFQDHPVLGITWENARRFCSWNGSRRLPTEAEWEYAARAGQIGAVYPWRGFRATDSRGRYLANFSPEGNPAATGYSRTAPVGSFPPNRWGIHDVAGNAAEWVEDAYTPSYDHYESGQSDPAPFIDESENERVVRGGSWRSNSFDIGVGVRDSRDKDRGSQEIGFRCAANVTQVEGDGQATDIFESMPASTDSEEDAEESEDDGMDIDLPDNSDESDENEEESDDESDLPPSSDE